MNLPKPASQSALQKKVLPPMRSKPMVSATQATRRYVYQRKSADHQYKPNLQPNQSIGFGATLITANSSGAQATVSEAQFGADNLSIASPQGGPPFQYIPHLNTAPLHAYQSCHNAQPAVNDFRKRNRSPENVRNYKIRKQEPSFSSTNRPIPPPIFAPGTAYVTACQKCSEPVSSIANFCPVCGFEQQRDTKCTTCQQSVPSKANFCAACGTPRGVWRTPVNKPPPRTLSLTTIESPQFIYDASPGCGHISTQPKQEPPTNVEVTNDILA
eukprot:gene9033-2965_t